MSISLTKLSIMKFNFAEQIGLFCMLVFQLNLAHAQPNNKLFFKELVQDAPATKTINDSTLKAGARLDTNNGVLPTVPLQPRFQHYVQKYLAINGESLEQIRETHAAKFNT